MSSGEQGTISTAAWIVLMSILNWCFQAKMLKEENDLCLFVSESVSIFSVLTAKAHTHNFLLFICIQQVL